MARRARTRVGAVVVLVALLGALAGCGDGAPVDGSETGPVRRHGATIAETIDDAVFTVDCEFSHRAPDDPIVYPGEPGASHMHDFFGAAGTDASSTARSLEGGRTTCEDHADTAAYWAPTLYDGATPIQPTRIRAYYRAAVGADVTEVQPPPFGLEVLAGDMHRAAGDWPDLDQVAWGCGFRPRTLHHTPPTDCTVASPLTLRLVFADCWNGHDVRSADHRSHVAYSTNGVCPTDHPVPILQVQVSVEYPVWKPTAVAASPRSEDLTIASGAFEGSHGDFFNSWNPERLADHTTLCVREKANCTIG